MKLVVLLTFGIFLSACSDDTSTPSKASSSEPDSSTHDVSGTMADKAKQLNNSSDTSQHTFSKMQMDITFNALDGLLMSAYVSEISEDAPYIILCHQAGYSRGEYVKTQHWFNSLGYNTLAIDQRSGEGVNDIVNQTAERAKAKGLPQDYLSAEQDIRAAVGHVAELLADLERDIYLVGSSYSASLVLKIAADKDFKYRNQIKGVISFSPGEYFENYRLSDELRKIECPVFLTSSKSELPELSKLVDHINPYLF